MNQGYRLYQQARKLIPGGTQLLSKRPEMFLPQGWPSYYRRAKGVWVETLEGERLADMSLMGVGACILGYADREVDEAAHRAIKAGVMCTLNVPEEVELAELLCELHPWAQMVRYTRSGGEAVAVAVRIARACTGRDLIAFCGYHGWSDWYLAANLGRHDALDGHLLPGLQPTGVPRGLFGTAFPFHYNRLEELQEILERQRGQLAAVIMEPQRGKPPRPGFLEQIRELTRREGAVLIFDEITTGFRMGCGGIHLNLGVEPDLAVFAKAMANGYAMAAVLGRREVMEAAQKTFISSTNWTERIGPAAALATIRKHRRLQVHEHLIRIGRQVQEGWREAARRAGLSLEVSGLPSLSHFEFQISESRLWTTFFTQRMLARGYLAGNQFKPSLAHTPSLIQRYLEDVEEVFLEIASQLREGRATAPGQAAQEGFYRLT